MNDLSYWRAALAGEAPEINADNPHAGYYRMRAGKDAPWLPVVIFTPDGQSDLVSLVGSAKERRDPASIWTYCANKPVAKEEAMYAFANGNAWQSDPPPLKSAPVETEQPIAERSTEGPPAAGDNSGDLDEFRRMKADLEGDISEAQAHCSRCPIKTKTDADKVENWRKRIADAGKAADAQRRAEKIPIEKTLAEIDARWNPLIAAAKAQSGAMGAAADAWAIGEQARLRKIAEDAAQVKFETARAAAQAERNRIETERAALMARDPIAARTDPEPELPVVPTAPALVIEPPKVMLGTTGIRRSARADPDTAEIVDLKAAAAHYASQQHPDLVALIKKLADKAAKAKATVPGCRMSWEKSTAKEAAE